MEINGWEYDYTHLPHWKLREKFHSAFDMMCENEQMDTAVLIYSIVETRMCYQEGFLLILKNKETPKIILNVTEGAFLYDKIVFSLSGRFAFIISSLYDKGWPVFIFDLLAQRFSCFQVVTNNISFSIEEVNETLFAIIADKWQMEHDDSSLLRELNGTQIVIDKLKWLPFERIDSFCLQFQ